MITDKEIEDFWKDFTIREDKYFLVWFFGFFTGSVIIAHILKHVFKVKTKFWLLNDTVDGDYGADWWLEREGLKPSLYSAFRWWWRNKAWNYYIKEVPEWDGGNADEFRVIKLTLSEYDMTYQGKYNRFTKANKNEGVYGINYYCYRLKGKVFCNYSEATENKEKQFGAGGNEYRQWIKR